MNRIKDIFKQTVYLLRTKEKIPILISNHEDDLFRGKVALITGGSVKLRFQGHVRKN